MVRFNDDVLTSGMYWNKPECAQRVDPPAVKPTPVAAITAPQRKVTLGADGLFRFDGGSLVDLLPQGRGKLESLASEIKRDARSLDSIVVTGHTDWLGAARYNQALSTARASTVRDVLVRNGINADLIRVMGKGEAEPRVQCEQKKREELIACLAPNRRVEIEVFEGR
jgi:outer membrane protein OmpA-like peptidoglycan-associated protein